MQNNGITYAKPSYHAVVAVSSLLHSKDNGKVLADKMDSTCF